MLRGEVAERARELIRQTCQMGAVQIVRGAVSVDHVQMLVAAGPQLSPAKLVQYVKGRSLRRLQRRIPAPAKEVLRTAPVGAGLLLCDGGRGERADRAGVH